MTSPGRFKRAPFFRFATHNVMELPLHRRTIPRTINAAMVDSDVIMWQELSDDYAEQVLVHRHPNYRHDIRKGVFNDARISALKPLTFGRGGKVRFQRPEEGVSHERYITWDEIKGFPGCPRIIASSRHYWPGAFNHDRADRRMRHVEWLSGQAKDYKFMTDIAIQGIPAVHAGDYNRLGNWFPEFFHGFAVHHFGDGLDHMVFVDGHDHVWKFPPFSKRKIIRNTDSDHNVLIVRAKLEQR